jgi:hypothetical protein
MITVTLTIQEQVITIEANSLVDLNYKLSGIRTHSLMMLANWDKVYENHKDSNFVDFCYLPINYVDANEVKSFKFPLDRTLIKELYNLLTDANKLA